METLEVEVLSLAAADRSRLPDRPMANQEADRPHPAHSPVGWSGNSNVTVFKQAEQKALEKTCGDASEGVNKGVNALIRLISEQPGLRAPAIAKLHGTSPKNIERWLKQLKDQDKIELNGVPKNGGYYSK